MVADIENDTICISYIHVLQLNRFYLFIVFMKMTCPFVMCSLHNLVDFLDKPLRVHKVTNKPK